MSKPTHSEYSSQNCTHAWIQPKPLPCLVRAIHAPTDALRTEPRDRYAKLDRWTFLAASSPKAAPAESHHGARPPAPHSTRHQNPERIADTSVDAIVRLARWRATSRSFT